jgi:hypothetical protein
MSTLPRVGDLELDQDLKFQRRSWRVQRIGWIIMAIILAAAFLGLFGTGPLSDTTVSDPSGNLRLEYERFIRFNSPTVLRIAVRPEAAPDGNLQLWFSRDYLEGVRIEQITPRPLQEELSNGRLVYTFLGPILGDLTIIEFHLTAYQTGTLNGQFGINDGQALQFRQFSYP